jgi:two-component system, OmpR family, KDP operon response regulator KdpE
MTADKTRILVVDDEPAIRRFLNTSLSAHGYAVFEAVTGEDALQSVPSVRPDLVILDLGLPGISGVDVARSIREWAQTPIIILSVREQESDKIDALDAGADDYLTKPFSVGELLARMRAALRRSIGPEAPPVFMTGELVVDVTSREVRVAGEKVQLTPTEYDLLKALVAHPGRVLTHRQLTKAVWGGLSYLDELHLLRVNISNLRHKIEPNPTSPRYIVTEPGVGYRLQTEP